MIGPPAPEFDALPDSFRYKYRELIETGAELEGALYYTPEDESEYSWSFGAFVVEVPDEQPYREVLRMHYKQSRHREVIEILSTVRHE